MVLKKQKNPESSHIRDNNDAGVGEDKISNLPDELIHHILSFLPTKGAMSTCILSKRWKCVVNCIPILDFRCWRSKKNKRLETKSFKDFLDRVLFLHEKPNIQKFYLVLDDKFDESQVNRWISAIMKHKVVELCLRIKCQSTYSRFPLLFFTWGSVTLLDLDLDLDDKFIIPSTVYIPKLKILRLTSISFVDKTSTRKLFSNCPILEELRLFGCSVSEGLCIVNPVLKNLSVNFCYLTESTVVEIFAPNLLTIGYSGYPPADFVLNSFPSLVEVDVDFHIDEKCENSNQIFVKLFERLSSAKLLKISARSFMVLKEADIILNGLHTFNNLIHLEISSLLLYSSLSDSISKVITLFKFLELLPNLESVLFAQSIYLPAEEDGCLSLDPEYSLPHLKSIKFKYFTGEQRELNAIKFFLKYAGFLEIITIIASPMLSKREKKQLNIKKLLLKFPIPAQCVVDVL